MAFLAAFVLLLALVIYLRIKTGNKVEIKTNDILVALIPIVLLLFLTGRISKLKFGDLEIEQAFKEAYAKPIKSDVTAVDKTPESTIQADMKRIQPQSKGSLGMIPILASRETEALTFQLGSSNYRGDIIYEYFRKLPQLKYIILKDRNNAFYGLLRAETLNKMTEANQYSWYNFADDIRTNNLQQIQQLPSFVPRAAGVTAQTSRLEAMETFEKLNLNEIPVLQDNEFIGVLERDKVVNKLLITISKEIKVE
jgi:hypothetical protein